MLDKKEVFSNISKIDCSYCQAWAFHFYQLLTLPHVTESGYAMAGAYVVKTINSTLTTKSDIQVIINKWQDWLKEDTLSVNGILNTCKAWIKLPNYSVYLSELFEPIEFTADTALSLQREPCNHGEFDLPEIIGTRRAALNIDLNLATSSILGDLSIKLDQTWKDLNDYLERIQVLETTRVELWEKSCQFQNQSPLEHANTHFFPVEFIPLVHRIELFTQDVYELHTAAIDIIRAHFTTMPIRKYIKVDTETDTLVTNIHIYMNRFNKVGPKDKYLEDVHKAIFISFIKVITAALDPRVLLLPEAILYLKFLLSQGELKEAETVHATNLQFNETYQSLLDKRKEIVKQYEHGLNAGQGVLAEISNMMQVEGFGSDMGIMQDLIDFDTASEGDVGTIKDSNLTDLVVTDLSESNSDGLVMSVQSYVSLIDLEHSELQESPFLSLPVTKTTPSMQDTQPGPCLLEHQEEKQSSPSSPEEENIHKDQENEELIQFYEDTEVTQGYEESGLAQTHEEIGTAQTQETIKGIQAQENIEAAQNQEKIETIETQEAIEVVQTQEAIEAIQIQKEIKMVQTEEDDSSLHAQEEKEIIQDQDEKEPIQVQEEVEPVQDQDKAEPIQDQEEKKLIHATEENELVQIQDETEPVQDQDEKESIQTQDWMGPVSDQEEKKSDQSSSEYADAKTTFDKFSDTKDASNNDTLIQQEKEQPWSRASNRSNNRHWEKHRYDSFWGHDKRHDKDEDFYWERKKPDILKGLSQSYGGGTTVTPVKKPEMPPGLVANEMNFCEDLLRFREPLPELLEELEPHLLAQIIRHLDRQAEGLINTVLHIQEESRMLTSQYMETARLNREREVKTISLFERQREEDFEKVRKYTGYLEGQLKKR